MSETQYESDEAVEAALRSAVEADTASDEAGREQAVAPSAPVAPPAGETESPEPVPAAQPAAPEAVADAEETFDSGTFNPDTLPPELQAGWRQLQGAFTRKTQELAAERAQVEALTSLGVDTETVTTAVDLYTRINDPANWATLYEQIGQAMAQHGIETEAPAAPATTPPTAPAAEFDLAKIEALAAEDPELAPLAQAVRSMQERLGTVDAVQARLDAFEAQHKAIQEEAAAMQQHQALVQQIQAEEAQIREAFPHYKQEDIDAVYELSSFHNGNLIEAQKRYEDIVSRRLSAYYESKGTPATATPSPKPAAPQAPAPDATILDMEEEAVEHLRALQRAGELDF